MGVANIHLHTGQVNKRQVDNTFRLEEWREYMAVEQTVLPETQSEQFTVVKRTLRTSAGHSSGNATKTLDSTVGQLIFIP